MKRHGTRRHRNSRETDPQWNEFFSEDEKREKELEELRAMSLADTGLPVRTTNCLEGKDIHTVGDLAKMTKEELLEIPNFGETTLVDCRQALDQLGVPHPSWRRTRRKKRKR